MQKKKERILKAAMTVILLVSMFYVSRETAQEVSIMQTEKSVQTEDAKWRVIVDAGHRDA